MWALRESAAGDSFFERRAIRSFGWPLSSNGRAGDDDAATTTTTTTTTTTVVAAHAKGVTALGLVHGDALAVSAGGDNAASLWDTQSGACLCRFEGHEGWVSCLAIPALAVARDDAGQAGDKRGSSVADLHFVTGAVDGQALLWDTCELVVIQRGMAAAALMGKDSAASGRGVGDINPLVIGVPDEGAAARPGATRPLAPLEDVPRVSPRLTVRHGDAVSACFLPYQPYQLLKLFRSMYILPWCAY